MLKKILILTTLLIVSQLFLAEFKDYALAASPEETWLIDCGALADSTDTSGNIWVKDEGFLSLWRWGYTGDFSYAASTSEPIEGTTLETVYQTNRWGNMSYKAEVPNGTYKVTLMFAETHFNGSGQRVFDIAIEGVTLWTYVDIFAWSGGKNRAMELASSTVVTDGCIDITFPTIHSDYPLICGIKIEAIDVSDDAFLDFIEKKMFWFFWNEASPVTGLVKWGENNWGPGYSNVSSIAVDGFALSIYTIGAERGWVPKQEAYEKVMKMLNSFDTLLQNVSGFWYHMVYMNDIPGWGQYAGQRADGSEVSTVDSALFIMCALQAGEYFRSMDSGAAAAKAAELYASMNWQWFMGIGDSWQGRFINMGWKPESDGYSYIIPGNGGFYCNDWWNRYSESIFVDLLAFGSPNLNHRPQSIEAWTYMTRNWANAFGYNFINEPPLFTHQYHHLYFNLRDKRDAYTDYFLNTQKATLANRQTCLEDPEQRYELKRWGLTGCGSPPYGDYIAYGGLPGGYNDGTVAPTAAATSLMFTQDESMETIRYMFFKYKHFIWGLHGFCDSFNIQQNFRNQSASGLNNGAMIIGIENYRSGLIMNTFMQNPYAASALERAGFVETPQVIESSYEGESLKGLYAFDGNPSTRWSSLWYDTPQWLDIDFKTERTFNKITITWETAFAKSYKIQISNDRIRWTDLYSTNSGDGGIDEIVLPLTTTRYLRIYATERGTEWGYSIWEITTENSPGYWILNMSEMDWYENIAPYNSTGTASCQMILNYIREGAGQSLLNQEEIYRYAKAPGPYDGSELTADQVDKALGHYDPYDYLVSNWADIYDSRSDGNQYQGHNYTVDTYDPNSNLEAMNEYMRDICHWMAFPVTKEFWWDDGDLVARPNTPAAVPIYGTYNHWVVIKGYVTDQNPAPDPHINPWNTPDFIVYGFWIKDPLLTGIGQDVYVTSAECESNYFIPLNLNPGDAYNRMLLQVAEPPYAPSDGRVDIPKPVADVANLEFIGTISSETSNANLAVTSFDTNSNTTDGLAAKKQSWRDIVDKYLLLDPEAVSSFDGTKMGRPLLVKRLDKPNSDYYLVPFNKEIGEELLTSAVIILDANEGYFKEATWTKTPEKFLKLTEQKAVDIVRKYLKSGRSKVHLKAQLVWQPNTYSASPYKPYWKVTSNNGTWFVTQEGKIISAGRI